MSISIDADLQDDISVIEEMIDKYNSGIDIVYGVRNNRDTDSFFKRFTAQSFYKFMKLMGVKSVYNHADFRLLSNRAMIALSQYEERNLLERTAGESKYPLKKMISFAFDGITSFSIKPITMVAILGTVIIVLSITFIIYSFIRYFTGNTVSGWSSLLCSIWFLGGVQLLSIGIIGEYVGKTYIEVKKRPRYNVSEFLKGGKNEK